MIDKTLETGDWMAQTELLCGICPKCGEKLEVPAHLKQFSCMYCGARLTPAEIMPKDPIQAAPDENAEEAAAYYREHVMDTINNYLGIEKEVTRSGYADAFSRYLSGCSNIFYQLDRAVAAGALTLQDSVDYYLNALKDCWELKKSWKQSYATLMDTDKFVIAIFLVPMVRELKLSISEDYCKLLNTCWLERYPKSPFYLGTYEEMTTGFNKKFFGLCFITTAVCRYSGKPDDCAELTAFRNFRDGYLRAFPDGPALIDQYYDIAPGIVLHLELSADRDAKYAAIRETYLEPCFADLQAGRLKQCKERYTSMVLALEQEYLN